MSVLDVADDRRQQDSEQQDSPDTNSQGSDSKQTIDLAEKVKTAVDDFLSGLIPTRSDITVNWGVLSPLFSVVGDIFAVVAVLGRFI